MSNSGSNISTYKKYSPGVSDKQLRTYHSLKFHENNWEKLVQKKMNYSQTKKNMKIKWVETISEENNFDCICLCISDSI